MTATVSCGDERRRAKVRAEEWNGIDGVNVSADQRRLAVLLFGNAPRDLGPDNFRISGGRTVTDIVVIDVHVGCDDDPDQHDCVELTVDRPGDWSTYQLCVVEADPRDGPGDKPLRGFDPRYACVEFTFKQECSSELDCGPADDCPPETYPAPAIDYLAKDYGSFRQLLYERLALTMPAWTERHVPDIGVALVELLAYAGDQLGYYQDAVATEAYLNTARLRTSVRRHVRLVDYPMHDGCAARAWVCLETGEQLKLQAGDFRFTAGDAGDVVFEPVHNEDVTVYPAHNAISLWTWGNHECCLPKGATTATLRDCWIKQEKDEKGEKRQRALKLKPGDVLVFEEVRGAKTGAEADADPTHRQAVRLTTVRASVDKLYDQPILEVTWDREDALAFTFCVNARGGPECEDLEVGIARGNTVLVEHGGGLTWCGGTPELAEVPVPEQGEPGCAEHDDCGCPDSGASRLPASGGFGGSSPRLAQSPIPARFDPVLRNPNVTQTTPYPEPAEVARGQARQLRGIPERTRERLTGLLRKVSGHDGNHDGKLSDADVAYLTLLFGEKTLRRYDLVKHPRRALRRLLAELDDLLAGELERLAELVRRARSGYVLDPANEGWEIGQSWGEAEGEAVDANRAVFRGPAGEAVHIDPARALPAVRVSLEDEPERPWLPRRDLIRSGPVDRHFVGEAGDDGLLHMRFGDGKAGDAPPAGKTLEVRYRVGNGRAGNVGREAISRIVFCSTHQSGITKVRNPLPAVGGTDPELVSEVRKRAPQFMRHQLERAITPADYASLTQDRSGADVQRAAADLRWTGSWYEAQVGVDALGVDVAPKWLLDEVRELLHPYRRIGHDLAVTSARLVPLDLALDLTVEPDHVTGHVKEAVERALSSQRGGFFHPDNLTFGTPVRVSQIVAAAAAVTGVRHVEVTKLRRLYGHDEGALETGVLPMRPLEIPQLDSDPQLENGRLDLTMQGGR